MGEAPVLVRSTSRPGLIRIRAGVCFDGSRTPVEGELVFYSVPARLKSVYTRTEAEAENQPSALPPVYGRGAQKGSDEELKNVQRQQEIFLQP